jgi:hypothetical protein
MLFIDERIPTPDRDAGSLNAWEVMRACQRAGYKVSMYALDVRFRTPGYTAALERVGIECLLSPYVPQLSQHLQQSGADYDLIWICRVTCAAPYLADLRAFAPQASIVFQAADLHFLRAERQAELHGGDPAPVAELRARELAVIEEADCTVLHSPVEQALLARLVPEAVTYCFPWVVDVAGTEAGFDGRSGVMFLGGYGHPPNVDAVEFFIAEVLPLLLPQLPDLVFYVVGANPPPGLLQLQSEHVVVTGHVPDLRPWFDRCRVSVAPLRYGAGIKGKVAAAMSYGLPVVATPVAAEGIDLVHGENVMIGRDPAGLAASILQLYTDGALWQRVSEAGQAFVAAEYSHEAGDRHLDAILALAGAPAR